VTTFPELPEVDQIAIALLIAQHSDNETLISAAKGCRCKRGPSSARRLLAALVLCEYEGADAASEYLFETRTTVDERCGSRIRCRDGTRIKLGYPPRRGRGWWIGARRRIPGLDRYRAAAEPPCWYEGVPSLLVLVEIARRGGLAPSA
jgi:hypothetical protein